MNYRDLQALFFNWPTEPKPPIESFPINDYISDSTRGPGAGITSTRGWEIQMALAGFSDEDVAVWFENNILHIQGNNKHSKKVALKFKSDFHHKIACSKELDLSKSEVKLENGMLRIQIPISQKKADRKYLLGGNSD